MAEEEEKEAHRLFMKGKTKREPYDYLIPNELVRGEECTLRVLIKNMGETKFPGGELINPRVEWMGVTTILESKTIEALDVGESREYDFGSITPRNNGVSWIKIGIKAQDGKKVLYYQDEDGLPLDKPEWMGGFYVIDRELLNIILLLRDIKGEKEKK